MLLVHNIYKTVSTYWFRCNCINIEFIIKNFPVCPYCAKIIPILYNQFYDFRFVMRNNIAINMEVAYELVHVKFLVEDDDIASIFIILLSLELENSYYVTSIVKYTIVYIGSIIKRDIPILRFWTPYCRGDIYHINRKVVNSVCIHTNGNP